jgi:hypothetical protein
MHDISFQNQISFEAREKENPKTNNNNMNNEVIESNRSQSIFIKTDNSQSFKSNITNEKKETVKSFKLDLSKNIDSDKSFSNHYNRYGGLFNNVNNIKNNIVLIDNSIENNKNNKNETNENISNHNNDNLKKHASVSQFYN